MALNENFDFKDKGNLLLLVLVAAIACGAATLFIFLAQPGGEASGNADAAALGVGVLGLALLSVAIWLATHLESSGAQHVAAMSGGEEGLDMSDRTQDAIMTLLDEMSLLADGDLTVTATVTEDITGAIADAVNYTVEALRELVVTIKQTSSELTGATDQSLSRSREMVAASEQQSKQIIDILEVIQQLINSTMKVSGDAEDAGEVAERSMEVALKGRDAVTHTIDGMSNIREQIQETSKRIKRLGESSQEIGNIVELINDIAEQTNTQALNASIQAAMAGDAGRGFAVVADEVQRLAERSANATREIETLVKTIQADTHEAIVSMEKTTSGVVNGAELAENAGSALAEIEEVSRQLSEVVRGIAEAGRQQAEQARGVGDSIGSIRELTESTASGTRATGEAISQLAELADQLDRSVAGFKLSEQDVA